MIPPTSIDGTDITGATIDGTDVQEITVDGDVVFSAAPPLNTNVSHYYDPSQETFANNANVTTFTDQEGSVDLSLLRGTATYKTSGINGVPALEVQNIDFRGTFGSEGSQPFTFSVIVELDGPNNQNTPYIFATPSRGDAEPYVIIHQNSGINRGIQADAGSEVISVASTSQTFYSSPSILTVIFDGSNGAIFINGSIIVTGNIGNEDLNGQSMSLGERPQGIGVHGIIGEVLFYDTALSNSEVFDEHDRIAAKYGVTI